MEIPGGMPCGTQAIFCGPIAYREAQGGELAVVRGQHCHQIASSVEFGHGLRQQAQPVGVDHDGSIDVEHRHQCRQVSDLGAEARAHGPCGHPIDGSRRGRRHHDVPEVIDNGLRDAIASIEDMNHARTPAPRARRRHERSSPVARRARRQACDSARILVVLEAWLRHPMTDGFIVDDVDRRRWKRLIKPDLHHDHRSGEATTRGQEESGLQAAEGHRHVGIDHGRAIGDSSCVGIDSRWDVHCHDECPRLPRRSSQSRRLRSKGSRAADAHDAVKDHVGRSNGARRVRIRDGDSPTRGEECLATAFVHATGQQDGLNVMAAGGKHRTREEGVTPVVATPHEEDDARLLDVAEEGHTGLSQSMGSALHECAVGEGRHQRLLGPAHGGDVVDTGHDASASAMAWAIALSASWVIVRCHRAMPRADDASATVPRRCTSGRPDWSTRTSQSCQARPAGAPSALAIASLAAKRAAKDAGDRREPSTCELSRWVKSRSMTPGRRSIMPAKREIPTMSMPMPTIIDTHSTVTDLARLRGWSTSWPFAVAIAHAKTWRGTVDTSGCMRVGTAGTRIMKSA